MNRSRRQKHLIRVQADPQFVNCITDVANRQEHPQLFLQQIQLALDTAPEPPAPHERHQFLLPPRFDQASTPPFNRQTAMKLGTSKACPYDPHPVRFMKEELSKEDRHQTAIYCPHLSSALAFIKTSSGDSRCT